MSGARKIYPLTPDQRSAAEPRSQVWLRASAGTGKTQVLTARVIRLLLTPGVRPENLLCITFTKAGAAEMSERINSLLARWVQLDDKLLFQDLEAINADSGPDARKLARSLFASVLDAPGGGLQIMTIHGLAQSLLGSFPEEAGLIPGFKPVEGREQEELFKEALAEIVLEAEQNGNPDLISNIQSLSLALGEDGAMKFLKKCAGQPEAMAGIPDDSGAEIFARKLAGVNFDGTIEEMLMAALADSVIDRNAIEALAQANAEWSPKQGGGRATAQRDWLAMEPSKRAQNLSMLHYSWTSVSSGQQFTSGPKNEAYHELVLQCFNWSSGLMQHVALARYAERLAPALLAGKAFSARYASAKKTRGLVDFDDMIRKTAALLNQGGMGDWIRFKLDRRIDHILVDESQDTNRAQWDIIEKLSDDFFSGMGAKDAERLRTIFSVGDEKQAIFGFQGTDPAEYTAAGERFTDKIANAGQDLLPLSLDQSFRSNKPILQAVNAVFEDLDCDLGDIGHFHTHISELPDIGSVELMQPITTDDAQLDSDEDWISGEKRLLAKRIADKVASLVNEAPLLCSTEKPLKPGDIMILLRRRGEIAGYLVSQLHTRGVRVAGIDRLKLTEPLVVQDMMATIRFVLQPSDNFSLACLLVSPLFGWDQDKLLQHGYRPKAVSLWEHIRSQPEIAEEIEPLREILRMADFTTAYSFLENILSGKIQGRGKFSARLGSDALIPMEELLNLALQFEQKGGGTLQAFLNWFESGETEIKREMLPDSNEVRVMTVHGAKGLQAPVVIIADITSDPTKKPDRSLSVKWDDGELPLLNIRKQERFGRLAEVLEKQGEREQQEHLRLLYVAMTRAQEHLIMAGSLSDQLKKNGVEPEKSWFPNLQRGMENAGCGWEDDDHFPAKMRLVGSQLPDPPADTPVQGDSGAEFVLPAWLHEPAPEESKPPRPLVPSRIDDDAFGEPPASKSLQLAAERGRFAHMLFERITGANIEKSLADASRWLANQRIPEPLSSAEIVTMVEQVVKNPDFTDWFGPEARAEVPLAAVVGEVVVTGRIDRLLVTDGKVRVLDFKTGRAVPLDASAVPVAFLRQMAHYVAALEVIFPDHEVEAALLYSFAPKLITLPSSLLTPLKPAA